jgi:hypothetical protein
MIVTQHYHRSLIRTRRKTVSIVRIEFRIKGKKKFVCMQIALHCSKSDVMTVDEESDEALIQMLTNNDFKTTALVF